jgi:hypothetical protein
MRLAPTSCADARRCSPAPGMSSNDALLWIRAGNTMLRDLPCREQRPVHRGILSSSEGAPAH